MKEGGRWCWLEYFLRRGEYGAGRNIYEGKTKVVPVSLFIVEGRGKYSKNAKPDRSGVRTVKVEQSTLKNRVFRF